MDDIVQDRTDRLNELSLENENLERDLSEKEEQVSKMSKLVKELEAEIELNLKEKKNLIWFDFFHFFLIFCHEQLKLT